MCFSDSWSAISIQIYYIVIVDYFSSKQLLPFGFTEQCSSRLSPLITAHKLNVIFITMPRPGRRRAITLTGTNGARGWQRRDAKGMSIDQVARKEAEARCSSD